MNQYYKIKNKNHIFQILETNDFGKKSYIILNADGQECVSVNVKVEEHELYLSMVKYNRTYSISQNMGHGSDTILMVKSLLRFLINKEKFEKYHL